MACPLCGIPLPPAEGPTAVDQRHRPVAFRHCPRCRALVPDEGAIEEQDETRAKGGVAAPDTGRAPIDLDEPDRARRLIDRLAASATTLAWELAEHLPPPGRAAPVIDLGAGRGGLLSALDALAYPVRGCEPSPFLCQMARAAHLLGPGTLTNTSPDAYLAGMEANPPAVSAFVLWHVLDRHPDPAGLLRRCRALAPGGLLFVEFPVADPREILAEQRFWATPATVSYLADELELAVVHASLGQAEGLRAYYRVPEPDVVDLDRARARRPDPAALEAAYRARSPVFAHFVPEPDGSDPDETDPDGTDLDGEAAPAETDTGIGSRS